MNHPVYKSNNILQHSAVIKTNCCADDPSYLLCLTLIYNTKGMYKLRKKGFIIFYRFYGFF
jgi:hypothetical protein